MTFGVSVHVPMQYNATSFHPNLSESIRRGAAFAERMNALLLNADTKEDATKLAFKEIGAALMLHGYSSYWNRARPLLWAALHYRAKQYEAGLADALDQCGHLLEQHGCEEGWTIFNLEIRLWLCWPDSF